MNKIQYNETRIIDIPTSFPSPIISETNASKNALFVIIVTLIYFDSELKMIVLSYITYSRFIISILSLLVLMYGNEKRATFDVLILFLPVDGS